MEIINRESHVKVYETNDYSIFKKMKGNRDVNPLNLARLAKSIEAQCWTTPIYVNENLEVVDGQHRLKILEEMGKTVFYIILSGATTHTVHNFNNVNLKWSMMDYAKSYADLGKPEYVKFMEYYENHRDISVNILFMILTGGHKDLKGLNKFKEGELELLSDLEIENFLTKMETFKVCKNFKYQSFCMAVLKVLRYINYDHEKMEHKLDQNLYILDRYTNPSLQHSLQLLSEVYNRNCRREDIVQFESMYNVSYSIYQ